MRIGRYLYAVAVIGAMGVAFGVWNPVGAARDGSRVAPRYQVDPFWPKPLPAPGGHQWVTGEPGGSCIDSQDHVITVNRGNLTGQDGSTAVASPPVLEYDPEGNVVNAWGDRDILPNGIHGCFVDYQDNIWITGNGDGVAQKWSHDGSTMLLQIGTKGVCDWPANGNACGNSGEDPGANMSQELLNEPAEVAVDPNLDPMTGQRGSVYVADGYGNHRVVVFDAAGHFLRQWGTPGDGPGQFFLGGGGHPHCIAIGADELVYACDRSNHRVEVFDKLGNLQRIVRIDPPANLMPLGTLGALRATDIAFSNDRNQTWMFDTDLGNNKVWILDRALGLIVSGFGNSGQMAGEFIFPHTIDMDSKGNLYVAETINGRRIQKFVPRGNFPVD